MIENTQCGFIEDKLGLTNLSTFGDKVTKDEWTKDEQYMMFTSILARP